MDRVEAFSYNYSAKEQQDIMLIREKYLIAEECNLINIKKLDKHVSNVAKGTAMITGIIGVAFLGIGLSVILAVTQYFIAGVILGIIGLGIISIAYPVYFIVLKKQKEKFGPKIIRLADQLLK